MRGIGVASTLTVYHDGRFWVGMFERVEAGRLSVCRTVFGAEPSNEEILQLIVERYNRLRFTEPVGYEAPRVSENPKRRQRETSRELKRRGPSTKAQQAMSEEHEARARERKADIREKRDEERQERFEQRREKRKRRHRGR